MMIHSTEITANSRGEQAEKFFACLLCPFVRGNIDVGDLSITGKCILVVFLLITIFSCTVFCYPATPIVFRCAWRSEL